MPITKTRTENHTKYTASNGELLASVHQRADNGLWMFMNFIGGVVRTNEHESRYTAECEADDQFGLALVSQPAFPKGTPEYAAYEAQLRIELAKFVAGEAPYGFTNDTLIEDAVRNASVRIPSFDDLVTDLSKALDKYGDRDPDPEGGAVAQLTIAARALLDHLQG
jgi:hypothetical protein